MVQNQEFVNQLTEKISKLPGQLHTQMNGISIKHSSIKSKCIDTGKFLQNKVITRMCPSELYKTDVESTIHKISTRVMREPGSNDLVNVPFKDVITFNHKGIGHIEVPVDSKQYDGSCYGTTFSRPLNGQYIFNILKNQKLMMDVLQDFAKHNKAKAMPIWVELMQIQKDAAHVSKIGDKYDKTIIDKKLTTPIEIITARIYDYHSNDNPPSVSIEKYKIHTIGIATSGDDTIYLRYGSEKEDNHLRVRVSEINDYLILNQIGDELQEVFNDINTDLEIEANELQTSISNINDKFAPYLVTSEINGEHDYTDFYW